MNNRDSDVFSETDSYYCLRLPKPEDMEIWRRFDRHLPAELFKQKVLEKMAWLICREDIPVGVLRWGLFWDTIPFLNLIYLDSSCRRNGLGRWAMGCWEKEMRRQGYPLVMVSTQVDEEAQHFYRKLGYRDIGAITMDFPGFEQPLEMFLAKDLRKESNTE